MSTFTSGQALPVPSIVNRNAAAASHAQQAQIAYRQQLEARDGTGDAPAYVDGGA